MLILCAGVVKAQYVEEDAPPTPTVISPSSEEARLPVRPAWRDRIALGGNFWLNFGNNTYVDLSPMVGYRVKDNLTLGVGATYIYQRQRFISFQNPANDFVLVSSVYGGRAFARQVVYKNAFALAELEALNFPYYNAQSGETPRVWTTNPLIGAGVQYPIGNRGMVMMAVLYNLNYQSGNRSFYPQPFVVRSGFTF